MPSVMFSLDDGQWLHPAAIPLLLRLDQALAAA